ncbi:MAG: hypothetical protein P4L36_03890 [Holophaga sp.]|nr:hypothetical protein [Holophaga sp.]
MPVAAEQTQDPYHWPAARRMALVQDLAAGRDTLAGVAHRLELPVRTILAWQSQCDARIAGDTLLAQGTAPIQSRFAGPC